MEPEVGAVVVGGGIAGDYVVVLDQDAMAGAQGQFPELPTYARPEVTILESKRGFPEAVRAIALVKRELRFPGDEQRIIRADPKWDGNMMRARAEGLTA